MTNDTKIPNLNIEEMQKAGISLGHNVSRLHPKMKQYVSGIKSNIHTINLDETAKELDRSLKFIAKLTSEGKTILFVGTKIQAKGLVQDAAIECQMPYVIERWLGGTFTNFETISKRVQHFKDLEDKIKSGQLEKYTKKERLIFEKELESLRVKFGGIRNMNALPEAVLVMDMKKDLTCIKEAKKKGVKVIGIADTNIDPTIADYPIPANDDAIPSIKYILDKVKETILSSRV